MNLDNLTDDQKYFANSMKNSGIPITETDLKAKFEQMATDEGLVFKNPGEQSAWWRWLKSIAVLPVLWLIEYIIKNVIPNQFVKTATGVFLDILGWAYGIDRKLESKTKGLIRFSREITGIELTIAVGTWISTAPINGVVYRVKTTEEKTFLSNDFSILVPVEAENAGIAYNLASNYFVVLADPITGVTSVTNESDWITTPGADNEIDDDFRLRIRGHFSTVSDHHVNSVYQTIISSHTGFKFERIFIDHTLAPRGAGSADAYVLFDVGTPAQSYLDSVNAYIRDNGYHGHGDDIQVKAMPETPYDLTATVWIPTGMTTLEKNAIQTGIEQMIRCAFRENTSYTVTQVWPFIRFSMGKLSGELLDEFSDVISVEFNRGDIVSGLDIPRLNLFTVTLSEVI